MSWLGNGTWLACDDEGVFYSIIKVFRFLFHTLNGSLTFNSMHIYLRHMHAIYPCNTGMRYIHEIQACDISMKYRHAIYPCNTGMRYIHAIQACDISMQYRHAIYP